MSEKRQVCEALGLQYFPFLDESKEDVDASLDRVTIIFDNSSAREVLDFYADVEEKCSRMDSYFSGVFVPPYRSNY